MVRVMPAGCRGCRHYRWNRRRGEDWCAQADDGYTNDCLLDARSEEAEADELRKLEGFDVSLWIASQGAQWLHLNEENFR